MDQEHRFSKLGMEVLDEFQEFREMIRGLVAMLVSDGWTDEQARAIVFRVFFRDYEDFE
jgi:hypothetical protein